MKHISDSLVEVASPPDSPSLDDVGPATWRMVSLTVIVLSLLCGAYMQSEVLLGSDLGWMIRSVSLMFDGQRFGVDIFELNFPVAWYLCMPAAWGVEYFGLTEVAAIRLWIWIMAAASLFLTRACISRTTERSWRLMAEFSAIAVATCVLVGSSFGQREHLALILSLPYMFVVRLRSTGVQTGSGHAIVAGVLAGIAFSIKPYFVAVPLAVELSLFVAARGQWKLIRAETLAIAVAGSVSFCGTMVLSSDYLKLVVPSVLAAYWAYDNTLARVVDGYPVAGGVFIVWVIALFVDYRIARSSIVWFAAFAGWTASYFIQDKGFDYHGYPAMVCALALSMGVFAILAGRLRKAASESPAASLLGWDTLKIAGVAMMMLVASKSLAGDAYYWFRASTEEDWLLSRTVARRELIAYLSSVGVGQGDSVFVLSTHPYPAFPTLNYLGAEWVGPDMAQFVLPAWFRKDEVDDPGHRQAIDAAMTIQRQHVSRAVLESKPDFILVNNTNSISASPGGKGRRRIDYFAVFGTDPALAAAFSRYTKLAELQGIQVYARNAALNSFGSN